MQIYKQQSVDENQQKLVKETFQLKYQIKFNHMPNNNQKILQLNPLVSKLLDTLCFQLTIYQKDNNSISLLQILLWKKNNQINDSQFKQLYLSWLDSKSIPDILTSQQLQIFPKNQLITHQIIQHNFMTIIQLTKILQKINQIYNTCYQQKKPNNLYQLQQTQKIFSYLDYQGYIHLRLSSIFYWTAATMILDNITIPLNYQAFKIYMNNTRKQMCQIQGIVCLRCFKNYIFNLNSFKKNNYLQNIFSIFSQLQMILGTNTNHIPNIIDEVFHKWKYFPRFNSIDIKKKYQIYKRIFQENQSFFYDEKINLQFFVQKYSLEFVKCNRIDNSLLKQLSTLLKQSLNQHIDIFAKIAQKINSKSTERNTNLTMTTRNKSPKGLFIQHPQKKITRLSTKQRTPTKPSKNKQYKTRTPTKSLYKQRNHNQTKRQFKLSAEKIRFKNCDTFKDVTPTKSYRMINHHGSQDNDLSHQCGMKVGVEKDSVYYKMHFFKNKRVQSYDVVMKRLKNK